MKYITRGELRMFRKERSLSFVELAQCMGVAKSKIERWMKSGKSDYDFLPYSSIDFDKAKNNAPKHGRGNL